MGKNISRKTRIVFLVAVLSFSVMVAPLRALAHEGISEMRVYGTGFSYDFYMTASETREVVNALEGTGAATRVAGVSWRSLAP